MMTKLLINDELCRRAILDHPVMASFNVYLTISSFHSFTIYMITKTANMIENTADMKQVIYKKKEETKQVKIIQVQNRCKKEQMPKVT